VEDTIPVTLPWDDTSDVGADTGAAVDDRDYQVPFRFTGKPMSGSRWNRGG